MYTYLSGYNYCFIVFNHQDTLKYKMKSKHDKNQLYSDISVHKDYIKHTLKRIKNSKKNKNKDLQYQFLQDYFLYYNHILDAISRTDKVRFVGEYYNNKQ